MQPVRAAHLSQSRAVADSDAVTLVDLLSKSSLSVDAFAKPLAPAHTAPKLSVSTDRAKVKSRPVKAHAKRQLLKLKKSYGGTIAFTLMTCWWLLYAVANILMYPLILHMPEGAQNMMKKKGLTDRGVGIAFCVIAIAIIFFRTAIIVQADGRRGCSIWGWVVGDLVAFTLVFLAEIAVQAIIISERKPPHPILSCLPSGYWCYRGHEWCDSAGKWHCNGVAYGHFTVDGNLGINETTH